MLRSLIFILFSAAYFLTSAQTQLVEIIVRDKDDSRPIAGCHIITSPDIGTFTTDMGGKFQLDLSQALGRTIRLSLDNIAYHPMDVELDDVRNKSGLDTGSFTILMVRKSYDLDVVDIRSERLPEVVYSSQNHSIADYEFLDGDILLLAYEKRQQKASRIILVNAEMTVIDSIRIPSALKTSGLYRDYSDRVFLEAGNKVFTIEKTRQEGLMMFPVDYRVFHEEILPVVDQIGHRYYFSTWIDRFPAFDYYAYNDAEENYEHIKQVVDQEMMTMCRAEYKYLTTRDKLKMFRLELETGFEKEVLTCMGVFEEGLYYEEVYAPLFTWEDRLYLFDHPSNTLFTMDSLGTKLDSVSIDYHQKEKVIGNHFKDRILQDEKTGEFYALFQRPGGDAELHRIDILTGEVDLIKTLYYDYPEAIQVHDEVVYYTYRPFESLQKKYLYKEEIAD